MKKSFTWIYFEEKIKALEKYLRVQAKALKEALDLQATENKRRFEDLNGEAGRLHNMQEQYIPREVFERVVDDLRKELKLISEWKTKQEGKSQLLQYIPWLLTAISVILLYSKR